MLRNVLDDYLNRIKDEREFDSPFITLLGELGFCDIHFTHDNVEFGKDFIAKRMEDDGTIQYVFQSKAGDINQNEWRTKVEPQLREALTNTLSHPNFDKGLPRQVVLVTTGDFVGGAKLASQNWNNEFVRDIGKRPVAFWCKPQLLPKLEQYGLEGIHHTTAQGYANYAQFYLIYSKALQGDLSEREIEQYSYCWLDNTINASKRILRATIESEILFTQCLENGYIYEAIHAHLGALRVILDAIYEADEPAQTEQLTEFYRQALLRLHSRCQLYLTEVKRHWLSVNQNLVQAGFGGMMGYLVHCARILEVAGCLYFLEESEEEKTSIVAFIKEFFDSEPGVGKIPSDRHAVAIVLPTLALWCAGHIDQAKKLVQKSVVWLCDRYEFGKGLANFDADENTEVNTLLGYPFDFIEIEQFGGSFLATILSDLAAFLGDTRFYLDVINDIKACSIFPTCWQPQDTKGQFRIEGNDVITYPNIDYADTLTDFVSLRFAEHIKHEPRTFKVAEIVGALSLMTIMLLLRDRHFPTLWPKITKDSAMANT